VAGQKIVFEINMRHEFFEEILVYTNIKTIPLSHFCKLGRLGNKSFKYAVSTTTVAWHQIRCTGAHWGGSYPGQCG
jgi:hypothetical protein